MPTPKHYNMQMKLRYYKWLQELEDIKINVVDDSQINHDESFDLVAKISKLQEMIKGLT